MNSSKRSPLLPIFVVVLVDILGLTIILPLFPFYAEMFGASPAMFGVLVSTYAACQLVAGPILGRISDRVGRKPVLYVSQLGTVVGFLILAFAHSLWMLFLGRIIDGLTAGNITVAQAYVSDVTEPQNRGKAFGLIGVAFGLGFLVGPGISGMLAGYGLSRPIELAACLSLTSSMITLFWLPNSKPIKAAGVQGREALFERKAWKIFFERGRLSALLLEFFIFTFMFALFTSGFALFSERRYTWNGRPFGAREIGYVLSFMGFLGVIIQGGLLGRLIKKLGEERLVRFGFISCLVSYILLALLGGVPMLMVSLTIGAFGTGVLRPALTSLITQSVDRQKQGMVLGFSQSLSSISQIVAPILGGLLITDRFLALWAAVAALTALTGLWVQRYETRFAQSKAISRPA
jgi:multidrug resistance protein